MKHDFSLSSYANNIPEIMKKSKYQQYFIVLLFAYYYHMHLGLATCRIW